MSGVIVVGTSHGLALVFGKFPVDSVHRGEMPIPFQALFYTNTTNLSVLIWSKQACIIDLHFQYCFNGV